MSADSTHDSIVLEFYIRLLDDLDRGEEKPIEAYLALLPGHDDVLRREYAAVHAERPQRDASQRSRCDAHVPLPSDRGFAS